MRCDVYGAAMGLSMKYAHAWSVLLVVVLLGVSGGCPWSPTGTNGTATTGSGGNLPAGGGGGAANGSNVGPPASTGTASTTGDAGTTDTGAVGRPSPVTLGGTTSNGTGQSDALTVRFPGCDEPVEGDFWRAEILRLVNQARQGAGLNPVDQDITLEQEATQYACELVFYQFFGHVNPVTDTTLRDRAAQVGYEYWIIGENLAAGQSSPAEAFTAWMNSPCHRENIMNPAFTELGIGVRVGGTYGTYWVQEFGRPYALNPYPGPQYHDPECTNE